MTQKLVWVGKVQGENNQNINGNCVMSHVQGLSE
jgi:hypothetical protein